MYGILEHGTRPYESAHGFAAAIHSSIPPATACPGPGPLELKRSHRSSLAVSSSCDDTQRSLLPVARHNGRGEVGGARPSRHFRARQLLRGVVLQRQRELVPTHFQRMDWCRAILFRRHVLQLQLPQHDV
jgi:hypothetical protein